ncbi:glycosyltransferase family 4 protein [Roseomonas sp. HJA6]|uniref:Glycosyltransferase family 4 protein n=1 Tax=Roseomonas alba TaxID=2846776 RepID=A0ABS7ABX5_9PROT|nr:glycosyltransferase family 4 protein [Neoroseomonas alba]MBW6399272.1 glycosyltransferase family 4 protein [Neoroseomonas alba]
MTSPAPPLHRIAFLGNHPPRICGLATFTGDLRNAVAGAVPDAECFVLAMTDAAATYDYPPEVWLEIADDDLQAYGHAAEFLNDVNADVLCVQHEYGIFGDADGERVLALLRHARMPIVATLHTVLDHPTPSQFRVMQGLIRHADRLVVMTRRAERILGEVHGVPAERITVIPHGIPETPAEMPPAAHKVEFGAAGRTVLLTFGLLSPGKGIEQAIRAMPAIVASRPDVLYLVLGATHPNVLRRDGEAHRKSLKRLAAQLGVTDHVHFLDRFVDLPTLTRAIAAADIYLTPYLNEAQSVSGTLAYSFGMGKAVISTPYWHAAELLAEGRGVLVPFADPAAIASAVIGLLNDPERLRTMREAAYSLGQDMRWSRIGARYRDVFDQARRDAPHRRMAAPLSTEALMRAVGATALPQPHAWVLSPHGDAAPPAKLTHLDRLLDPTGIAQHATRAIVDRAHGYCLDDNARGLILATSLESNASAPADLFDVTAAFVQHAWDAGAERFRNFMAYDRRWLEAIGSDDSHGRAIWALGTTAARAEDPSHRAWAYGLLERAAPPVIALTSLRAWAFALLGVVEALDARPEDLRLKRLRTQLAERLYEHLRASRRPGWTWFEDVVSYDNARLPQALMAAGHQAGKAAWFTSAVEALDWLCRIQRAEAGHFRPVGSEGFWRQDADRAVFDQQPLEASATVGACVTAWRCTGKSVWLTEAQRAFAWFLGENDLGQPLYDAQTGGCRDGLLCDRVNENQGAESTLAFLMATIELRAALSEAAPRPDIGIVQAAQ